MLIIGHRGARGLAPENTLTSLQKAIEHGAGMLEFDVRVTKDGVPVLHHDGSLKSADGTSYSIKESNLDTLKQQKTDLTALAEVLASIPHSIQLYIEVKADAPLAPIVQVLQTSNWPKKQLFLASKKQKILLELQKSLPDFGYIVIESWSGVWASHRARQLGTKHLAMNHWWLWSGFISSMSHRGWQLYAYTLNNPKRAAAWKKYGLAGVVTDYPDRFK